MREVNSSSISTAVPCPIVLLRAYFQVPQGEGEACNGVPSPSYRAAGLRQSGRGEGGEGGWRGGIEQNTAGGSGRSGDSEGSGPGHAGGTNPRLGQTAGGQSPGGGRGKRERGAGAAAGALNAASAVTTVNRESGSRDRRYANQS